MRLSAELRWFGAGAIPEALDAWFRAPGADFACPVGGGRTRTDAYLRLGDPELGIKRRQGKRGLEIKGLVDRLSWHCDIGGTSVAPLVFAKWDAAGPDAANCPAVEVTKIRWLRTFVTQPTVREIALGAGDMGEDPVGGTRPESGCDLELTAVTVGGERWWTLGAEAFVEHRTDDAIDRVSRSLRAVIEAIAGAEIDLRAARYQGYAEWLATRGPD